MSEKKKRLTEKQIRFIAEYLVDYNGTQAAIRAGYSKKTAYSIAWENLRKPEIAGEIKKRLESVHMGLDEVLARQAEIARGDIADVMQITSVGAVVDLDEARRNGKTHLIRKVKQKTTTILSSNGQGEDREIHELQVELYPADRAQANILRVHGAYSDKLDISGEGISINVTIGGND